MEDSLVTVATYRIAQKAEMAAALLEQQGIRTFVADANMVTTDWLLGNAIGYAKLQVLSSQAELALQTLNAHPGMLDSGSPPESDDNAPEKCLECGATMPEDSDRCSACGWSYDDDDSDADTSDDGASDGAEPGEAAAS